MARISTPPQAVLSYLVGPGPRALDATSVLRVGLSNFDECVHALRVVLSVLPGGATGRPLAQVEWEGLLPRRSQRELAATIDWRRAELRLEGCSSPFAAGVQSVAKGACLLRAELFDGRERAPDVLEIGLADSRADAGAERT